MTTEPRSFARRLRASQTDVENRLWQALRGRKLDGLKFRRQVPLLAYTVDFLCAERRLIIELDGKQHDWHGAYDMERTAEIEAMGFMILRFRNEQLTGDLDPVLQEILQAAHPTK
ncbi:endonuclease domain-containing protein [Labrys monachus]|uniref:Very-short-patch-repair endonuclease n=1 Tax=Labrys monachus TaxID=217067 RepID=A0ABU0FLE4_9HYPH|nr:DUF559 domain-containing protein [Labrys monachus]MDQ0395425.1 very-short-patch-repair endonuclease [Labrys monachus]